MKVTFSSTHNAFQVIAPKGTLISLSSTPTALADGVYVIGDDGVINIDEERLTDSVYLSTVGSDYTVALGQRTAYPFGDNTVIIRAGSSAIPFKKKAKGGDVIEVESLEATENKTYTAPTGKAYNPVVVNVPYCLDGVNYDISGISPTVKQGRFWGNWQNQKSIRPIDSLGNYVKVDWSQDWEIGFAFLIKDQITYTSYTFATGVGASLISWAAAPATFICHEAYSSEPTKFIAVRKADTTKSDYNLWSVETGFDEGCLPDTWYFVKIGYNSTTKTLSASVTKDFENWNTSSDTHSDRTPYTGTDDYISFAGTNFYGQSPNDDIILDLANCYIKQNDIMIWGHFDGKFASENHYVNPAMQTRAIQDETNSGDM